MAAKGILLEQLTWVEAEAALTPRTVVVIPLGAQSKEHGPHLRLNNDWAIAEYFKRRVIEVADVVAAPTIGYHYYPAFGEYPGSVSLRLETARDLVVDICASLSAYGPRRFYVLNTGVSTVCALAPAAGVLAQQGTLLRYTDIRSAGSDAVRDIGQQEGGSHADEIETSMMLYIAPEAVEMAKAARDYRAGQGRLTRQAGTQGIFSPTGIYGDATLATWAKGRSVVEARLTAILTEIERLRAEPLPPPI
jgi:creatinine amidohydrolase